MNKENIEWLQGLYRKSNIALLVMLPLAILFIVIYMFNKWLKSIFDFFSIFQFMIIILVIILFIILAFLTTKLKKNLNREYSKYLKNEFDYIAAANKACISTIQSNNKYSSLYKIICSSKDDSELRQLASYYNTRESYNNFIEDLQLYNGNKKNENFAKMLIDYRVNNMNVAFNKPKKRANLMNVILIAVVVITAIVIILLGIVILFIVKPSA